MEREGSWGKLEREMNHERLWTLRNKQGLGGEGGGGWVSLVMVIMEGMNCMAGCGA